MTERAYWVPKVADPRNPTTDELNAGYYLGEMMAP